MDKKIKIIVFATGWASDRFVKNCRDEYDIIALSDWDKSKHNTIMNGYKIIDPYEISNINFDKIVIASQYSKEITKQIKDRLNIEQDKLIYPLKYQLKYGKPFEDDFTRKIGREMIIFFTNMMRKKDVNLYLDQGTLIGIVRDGDIIAWDDDIDFRINQIDVEKVKQLLLDNKNRLPYSDKLEWKAKITNDTEGNTWNISLIFENKKLKFINEFEIGVGVRKIVGNNSIGMLCKYNSCNKEHFEKYDILDFENGQVIVPYKYEEYLSLLYGNWKTPEKFGFEREFGSTFVEDKNSYKVTEIKQRLF